MITPIAAIEQCKASWAMAAGKADWPGRLDCTAEGVFRSFQALVYALPFAAGYAGAWHFLPSPDSGAEPAPLSLLPWPGFITAVLVISLLAWVGGIVMLAALSRPLGQSRNAAPLIAALNWSGLIVYAVSGSLAAIAALLSYPALLITAGLVGNGMALYLNWGIIRRTLLTPVAQTVILLVMLLMLEFSLVSLAQGIASLFGLDGRT